MYRGVEEVFGKRVLSNRWLWLWFYCIKIYLRVILGSVFLEE